MTRKEVFDWCTQKYDTKPDYPWNDGNAVLRHSDNNKWYGVILEVGRDKLGLSGEGEVDVLNLKCEPMLIGSLRAQKGYLPAYHMNKENWISILLDGSVPEEEIKKLIDLSHRMTKPKKILALLDSSC